MSERQVHVLLASAGSGKTWQLTTHFLRQLVRGVPAQRVLASTFTRKAAGEILGRVLQRLARAASDETSSAALSAELGVGVRTKQDFVELLARLVRDVHEFRVRTLDAFFGELARGFAGELGLPPNWRVADELELKRERSRAAAAALEVGSPQQWLEWLGELQGAEASRTVHAVLADAVESAWTLARDSDAAAWGRLTQLPLLERAEIDDALARLSNAPLARNKDGSVPKNWSKAVAALSTAVDASDWETVASNGFVEALIEGRTTYSGKEIPSELAGIVDALMRHAAGELARSLAHRSRAAREVLDAFDVEYAKRRAERGALSFDDVPRALSSSTALASGTLDELALRLDARIDHVLLDEFQDTAPLQWRLLAPLVEELAAVSGDERSVFVVGDVKQSIYGWRAAEPRLLELLPQALHVSPSFLDRSHRSAQVVLDAVNRVFVGLAGNAAVLRNEHARRTAEAFVAPFRPHAAARSELAGEVRVHTCALASGADEGYSAALSRAVEIVLEIRSAAPAAKIAVLLRRKKLLPRLVYALRRAGVPASGESGNQLGDSAAVLAALSLLWWIDHPDDSAAHFHAATSPFGAELGLALSQTPEQRRSHSRALAARILDSGLARFLETLRSAIARSFGVRDGRRFGQLVDAAFAWPQARGGRLADFVERARAEPVDDSSAALVKVMTVHAAKGLEFDAVVLPELEPAYLKIQPLFRWSRANGDPRLPVDAVLRNVPAPVRDLLVFAGAREIGEAHAASVERELRDDFGALYVAMTRAVHRVDLILRPEASKEPPFSAAGIVREAFGLGSGALVPTSVVAVQAGSDPSWTLAHAAVARAEQPAAEVKRIEFGRASRARDLERVRPSSQADGRQLPTHELLASEDESARVRGSRFHAWLERVEWFEDFDETDASLLEHARALGFDGADLEHDLAEFRRALARPNLRRLLARRAHAQAWRERRFSLVFDARTPAARLVSGAFDRVVVELDGASPRSAELIDFKTGQLAPNALAERVEHYRPQIDAYREALARITALPPAAITAKLVFVELDEVVEL